MSARLNAVRRVVIAPDSFKGSVDARAAADAIAVGWLSEHPGDDIVCLPMADGGEGTLDAIEASVRSSVRMPVRVDGPDGRPVDASWLLLPNGTGVVELAVASGIGLMDSLWPLDAHTLGFGQTIAAALRHGVQRLSLALGGSSSTDGGAGAMMALGARFLDSAGHDIALGGRGLAELVRIDRSALTPLPSAGAVVLADVDNRLCGHHGATAVFAPQKGATAADVEFLEVALARLAAVAGGDPDEPGSGAAGGTAFGLRLWGATMASGAQFVAAAAGIASVIADADLVITGEGCYDGQSERGKAPTVVAEIARRARVPVALVAGQIQADTPGFARAVSLAALAGSPHAAMLQPVGYLRKAGRWLALAQRTG